MRLRNLFVLFLIFPSRLTLQADEPKIPVLPATTAIQSAKSDNPQTPETKPTVPPTADAIPKKPSETKVGEAAAAKTPEATKDAGDKPKSEPKKADPPKVRVEKAGLDIIAGPWFDEQSAKVDRAAIDLRNIKIHLKFGLVEFGNINEFVISRQLLKQITKELPQGKPHEPAVSPPWLDSLRGEIDRLEQSARATLFGDYPLIRGFELPSAENEEEFRVNTYTKDSDAKRNAVRNALERLGKLASLDPQHVLVLIPGDSPGQEHAELARLANSESQIAFARIPNLKVYSGRFRESVDAMPAWEAPDPAFDPICRKFLKQIRPGAEPRSVMVVQVRNFEDQNLHWVQAQYRIFGASALDKAVDDASKLEADKVRMAEALARDVSSYNYVIWTIIGALYALAIVLHEWLLQSRSRESWNGWARWFALPSMGFFLGILLTRLAMLALADWLPSPRASAWSGTWWPCAAGSITLILPVGVFRLAAGSADRYWPTLSYHGHWGVAFLPVALGITAAWVHPAFYTVGWNALTFIPAYAAAASALAYCFGRAIDRADKFPVSMAPISMILTIFFGAAAFMGSAIALWIISLLALFTLFVHNGQGYRFRRVTTQAQPDPLVATPSSHSQPPMTLDELRKALPAPIYRGPKRVESLHQTLIHHDLTLVKWVGLTGPKASGKTAAIRFLEEELRIAHPDIQFLSGSCTHRTHRDAAYQPFREAFTMLGLPEGLVEAHTGSDSVNSIFDNLAYELIPFWTFFSFDSNSDGEKSSRTDLLIASTNALRKLSQTHPVVLILDDLQWIDEDSAALLKHLWTTFPPGHAGQLMVILAGRDLAPLGEIESELETVSLSLPSEAEQIRVLTNSLNLEPISAKHIVKALGVMGQEPGGMYWILRSVRELLDDNALTLTSRGFVLNEKLLQAGQLPVPHKMRDRLIASLRASGDSLRILECAALLGSRFRVSDVAECLKMDRLNLLESLRKLDRDSQLVRDVPLDQECYEFSSSFLHEVLREELGVAPSKSRKQSAPSKIARELHARIAEMMQRRSPRPNLVTYAVAEHFFEAGEAYVSQCIEACQLAIEVAGKAGDQANVERFTAMDEKVRPRTRESATRAQLHGV